MNSAKRLPKRINKGVAEMKAIIVRKVANIKDWHDAVAEYKYMHGKEMPKAEVKVEKTIHLTATEFDKVANDLFEDCKWVQENKDLMRVDEDGVWHMIALQCKDRNYKILINSEGFAYPRYTAIV